MTGQSGRTCVVRALTSNDDDSVSDNVLTGHWLIYVKLEEWIVSDSLGRGPFLRSLRST
jgi:hypothetical protein